MTTGFTLSVYVQPGASRAAVGGTFDGSLIVRVRERPIDGGATDAVRDALAEAFNLRPRQVTLVRGATSRHKTFALDGPTEALAQRHLELTLVS